jgi:hypothetical protein
MRLGLAAGPLLLLAWQVAPIQTQRDSTGRVRLSLGYGGGQFESRTYSCQGDLTSATAVPYKTMGFQVDGWTGSRSRITVFGGQLLTNDTRYHGAFGGAAFAWDARRFGLGAGLSGLAGDRGFFAPSVYLRAGNIDRFHVRADLLYPEPTFGTTGLFRLGVGFNQGRAGGVRGFGGLAISPYDDGHHSGGAFAEFGVPLNRNVDLEVRGAVRSKEVYANWGVSGGLRVTLGR